MQLRTGKDLLFPTSKGQNILRKALLCLLLYSLAVTANAQEGWWFEKGRNIPPPSTRFKVSFNSSTGSLHVESYAYNPCWNLDVGIRCFAMWVDYAYLSFSTNNGNNWNDFYLFGNVRENQSNYGNVYPQYAVSTGTTTTDRQDQIRTFDLQLRTPYTDVNKIKIAGNLTEDWRFGPNSQLFADNQSITIPQMSLINEIKYDFVAVQSSSGLYEPKVRLSYKKSTLNDMDRMSAMVINESIPPQDQRLTGYLPVGTSGSYDLPVLTVAKNYYYQQLLYNERWYNSSSPVTVPAFTFPKTASAAYDPAGQKVTFSWTMDPVTTSNVIKDRFKLQVADNPDFTDARDVSIDYDQTKSSYSYTVDKDLSPQMYFRVARARNGFDWELAKTAKADILFTSIPFTIKAELVNKSAKLTWDPVPSAWLPGSILVITKFNNTAKTQNEIRLSKADFDKGTYTDLQITTCNSYNYSFQVVPPAASKFTAFSPVQAPEEILPTEIGTLVKLDASKGYFPDRTELRWSSSGVFDNFIIKRAAYGSANFVQIATVPGSSNSEYQTDDAKGTPGTYYAYQVIGTIKCNNTTVASKDTLLGIGFRSPTGNIYGRITYENGQAVEDVAVRLQSNDQVQLGKSIYLNGTPESYLKLESTTTPFSDSAFTIEMWIKPDDESPINQTLFFRGNLYELGFNADGKLFFIYNGGVVSGSVHGTYRNTNHTFVHVTAIHTKDSLFLLLNNELIASGEAFYNGSAPSNPVYIGSAAGAHLFKGFIDEVRIYNIALSYQQAVKNCTRLVTGDEPGLAAYYRFDETITDQFYDLSFRGDTYNRNDGTMNPSAVRRSTVIPTLDQLSLKSFTDISGNYFIAGIPYNGNGTTYTIVPLKGTHQFDPISVNRLISPSSTQFTVDFKDKSSFIVSGNVYYKNTTVPVPGVFFRIDGQYAQKSNGEIIQTGEDGAFTISVPVGVHEVKGEKVDHGFANGGRLTDLFGNNLNYQSEKGSQEIYDTTTIRFIGRVAGGAVQQDQPLGHSVSVNNLGKEIKLTMKLPPGAKDYKLNLQAPPQTVVTNHFLPSNIQDSSKISKTKITYSEHSIVIEPDPKTGEFVADLIPVKFLVDAAEVTGWGNILKDKPQLDFTNKFAKQSSVRSYVDSMLNNQNTYVKTAYRDSLTYNASYKFILRVTPSVAIVQKDGSGKPLPYFGNLNYESLTLLGKKETINVVDTTRQGLAMYRFGRPVFAQNQLYTFGVSAFEQYPFYDSITADNIPIIKQEGGKDVLDNVPTTDGLVSVFNTIRNGKTVADTFSLDNKGTAEYKFAGGDPELLFGLRQLAAKVNFGEATVVNWTLYGNTQQEVFVMGAKLTGTDFVTAGPDRLLMVLRDPPGSKSFSFAEKGSTISRAVTYKGSVDQVGKIDIGQYVGFKMTTFLGLGAGKINRTEAGTTTTFGIEHEEHFTNTDTKEETTTLTTRFQTSDDPLFAGPVGDVFVGYSTNITYGASNNVTIIARNDRGPTDSILFDPPDLPYLVVKREGISLGEQFGTLFAFPQQHLEKILIPNLKNIRNSILLPPATQPADAQALANSAKRPVYVSKIAASDTARFGRSNRDPFFGDVAKSSPTGDGPSYKIYFPESSLYRTDTIMVLNQYVANWQKRMADNEKAKLESELIQNYSFHAGSPVSHSITTSIQQNTENAFEFILSGTVVNNTELKAESVEIELKTEEKLATSQGGNVTNSTEKATTLGFTLASSGTDDYFSIDLRRAADSSLVFRTKGGVSACPYMGEVRSKYYQPGTLIDQATQRSEVPVLSVDKPVAANVPSSRKAVYNLILRNESESKLPTTFVLGYTDVAAINGATIAVDGAPIGGGGRAVYLQFGESVTKVLTLTKGPDAMDYENIPILLHSACQYDPTGYRENIADTVLISAHFIPSCSDINLKSPKDKWVLNSESPVNQQGRRYLPIVIDQFDVNNTLFDHIALQYKPASSSTWVTFMKFYADSTKFNEAQGEKSFITNPQGIFYNFVMDDANYSDQAYDIQAVSYCKIASEYVTTESNGISGIKDTYNPRLFGSPQPANGVLTANDNVRLNFNETIAAGLITSSQFQVTGIRNGAKRDHAVSARLDGVSNFVSTEFEKSFTGKNITAEMWILPKGEAFQTLFSHGDVNESMELALTVGNQMRITVGTKTVNSPAVDMKPGEWAHVALVYNDNNRTVSAFYNFVEMIHNAPVNAYTGTGRIEFGRSIRQLSSYFNGSIHEARIWSDTLNSIKLQVNSLSVLSGAESGLIGYYPMNEGKGSVVFDKAHGSNAVLNGLWNTSPGKGVRLNGNGYVKVNTSSAPVLSAMDYTLELWFRGDATQGNATLASSGKGDKAEAFGSQNLFSLGFENSLLTFRNNGFKVQADGNYLDNKWHHVALAVNRNGGIAQLFVDGLLNQFFDAQNLGGLEAAYTYLGVRAYYPINTPTTLTFDRNFTGNIDEFRIWNTYLNQTLIAANNNVRLQGNELGLLAYYPFETFTQFQGNTEMYYSLKDAKLPTDSVPEAVAVSADESDEAAPIKNRGPVENLRFDYVVNNDALIINLLESKAAIDKTVITFRAENVRDMNGNKMLSPVSWTAYIDQNPLKWSDQQIDLVKEVGASMTFESRLVNNGGSAEKFTIYNLPSWLRATPSSGSVDSKGNLKISFAISEGLNIGSYEEIIFMRNDNNETEALKITLQVKGKKPDWVVKASDFDNNMAIYGKIRINNVFSTSNEDMVGAFINGKCVGLATNTYLAANDLWYVFLTVYSNEVSNSSLEFRIWQASTGKTFKASASQFIGFAKDAIVGTVNQPVILSTGGLMYQNMAVNENWNWISFNLGIPAGTPVTTTLVNGNWTGNDIIKNESSGGGPTTGFSSYVPNSGWKGSLANLGNLSMFKLKAGIAQSLTVSGTPVNVVVTPIPLKGGQWNYISYLPQVNATLKEALANYVACDEDVIKSQTGFAMYSTRNGWVGSLTYLEPGRGYMLYRKAITDTAFRYPTINGSLGGRIMGAGVVNKFESPVVSNFRNADNMTLAAIVATDFDFRSGDSVLAFVNGELRAKTKPVYNPEIKANTFFFTIGGDAEQPVVFMIERSGELIAQATNTFSYRSNSHLGTLSKPLELHFLRSASGVTVYPNPFNSNSTISVDLRGYPPTAEHRVQVSVLDMTGKTVMQLPAKTVSGTGFTTTWNGRNTAGSVVANGIYFVNVVIDGVPHVSKLVKQ
jgi:hypothetical protein